MVQIVQIFYIFVDYVYLIVLSLAESEVLKSPIMVMELYISSFNFVNFYHS